jgi:hypothetical protein
MSIFDRLFKRKAKNQVPRQIAEEKKIPSIEEFPKLNKETRMRVIMALGDSGQLDDFPFLKYAVLTDTQLDVKFAALKRIHLFKDHPDTITMLTDLEKNGDREKLEPYFSMALSMLGLISIEEFEKRMNNG